MIARVGHGLVRVVNPVAVNDRLVAIRNIAAENSSWQEIGLNIPSKVISFRNSDSRARLNIYYTTMTVGSALEHPVWGATQLFRRNCTMEQLEELFEDPRTHTGQGYYKRMRSERNGDEKHPNALGPAYLVESPQVTEKEWLRNHLSILVKEAKKAQDRLNEIEAEERGEEERKRKLREDEARKERERQAEIERKERERQDEINRKAKEERLRKRGKHLEYLLIHNKHFPERLDDTKCVAIGGGGYIAVSDNSTCSYHGIPNNVLNEIDRAQSKCLDIVAIGPRLNGDDYQYYILKTSGKVHMNVSGGFSKAHSENKSWPEVVVLGEEENFYIKFKDGGSSWSFPVGNGKVRGILNDYSIRCVWFGRNGSYFLGYIDDDSNYKQSYYNLPSYLAKYASNRRYEIIQMLYDYETENGFIRYNHV